METINWTDRFWEYEFNEHLSVVRKTQLSLTEEFNKLVEACAECVSNGGKLMFFGNGGSASDAQHLATELTVRYKDNRTAIAALALTTDTSALTAIGNDLGFDELFARQIEALGRAGDIAIGITTSGRSPNVLRALERAKELRIKTAALTGNDGGVLSSLVEHLLIVPSKTTARIQELHIMLGQMLCAAIEIRLGLVDYTIS